MSGRTEAVVEFQTKILRASMTRPANTTAYTSGDVLAAVTTDAHLTFEGAVQPKKLSGSISTARLFSSANQGTKLEAELWLFHTDITEVGDNEAFAPSDAELLTCIGRIDFSASSWAVGNAGSGASGNAMVEVKNIGLALRGAGQDIYGVLVARNAYTPVSGEVITAELVITQD